MGRDPEAWTDRAFWSNDPNITTCKDIWGTSATAEGSEGRQGSWGNEAQGSSIGEGRADSEILQELESYRDPSKVRKSSESWDRSAVGPTFLRPTSAHSSRLRSTVVSPRILLTSGRSGSGTCSSTSSHSDFESPGMARPRCCAPRRAPLDLRVHRSERWVTGILLVSRPGRPHPLTPRPRPGLTGHAPSPALRPASPKPHSLLPPIHTIRVARSKASGLWCSLLLYCRSTLRGHGFRSRPWKPGGPSPASSARPSPGKRGQLPQAPPPEGPGPAHSRAVPASKAQPIAVVGDFAVSTMHITLTLNTFHPWAS